MRFFLFFKIAIVLSIGHLNAQNFISATPNKVCESTSTPVVFTVYTGEQAVDSFFLYEKNEDDILRDYNKTGIFSLVVNNTSEYYAVIKNGNSKIKTDNEEKILVNKKPQKLEFEPPCDKPSIHSIVLLSNDAVEDLTNYLKTDIPSNHSLTISGKGVWDNKFYPSIFSEAGGSTQPHYTLTNTTTHCSITNYFGCKFDVKPFINTETSMIKPGNPPPYCETGGQQNIRIEKKQRQDKLIAIRINGRSEVFDKNANSVIINISPSSHINYQIRIEVEYLPYNSEDEKNITEELIVPIIPKFSPTFSGLNLYSSIGSTSSTRITEIKACASILRGEGTFTITKSHSTDNYTIECYKERNGNEDKLLVDNASNEATKNILIEAKNTYYNGKINFNQLEFEPTDILIIKVTENAQGKCGDNQIVEFRISFNTSDKTTPKLVLPPKPYCVNDTLVFNINTTTNNYAESFPSPWNTIYAERYTLNLGENESIYSGTMREIPYVYSKAGTYKLHFEAMNLLAGWNCPIDTVFEIKVGAVPTSEFEVKENLDVKESIFKNLSEIKTPSSVQVDVLTACVWNFGDGQFSQQFLDEIKHPYVYELSGEPYKVVLTVTTSLGCSDSITKYIPVFRLYEPTLNNPYINDFETDRVKEFYNSGTYKHFPASVTQNSSWKDTIPVGKDIKSDLYHRAWVTYNNKDTSYNRNEKSWVESPAFILDALERPMVRMNTWVSAEAQIDGVNFQYCIMDTVFGSETWKTLGKVGQGVNWYNSSIIVTKEGFEGGWTGTGATDWQLSAHELDNVKAEADGKPVRFRFSFTSNNENPPGIYNGFAFDNFFIGERNRIVLVENFRNTSTVMGTDITDWENDNQAAVINYYVGHLKKDVINDQNKADPSARALHYGVHQLPRLAIDGLAPSMKEVSWVKDSLEKRKLTTSEFDINFSEVKVEAATGELLLKGTLYRNAITPLERPVLIQVAIIEDQVLVDGQTYSNVLRKLLPNAAGKRIASWAESATEEIEYRWQPFAIPNSGYTVVVFIQDEQSKEIYQTNTWEISESEAQLLEVKNAQPISTSFRMPVYDEIILFPNPTNTEEVQVLFNGILEEECTWDMKDRLGIVHATGIVPKGVNLASLVLPDVPSGIYQLSFTGKGYRQSAKLSVVK